MPDAPNYQHNLVGVFGHPVAENPTGVMQEAGFNALGLMWRYLTIDIAPDKLADAMQAMRTLGMRGVNCTIPFKVEVLNYLDEISPDAKLIGAVNTIRRVGDRLIGENTDGKGFMRSLADDADFDPAGRTVVIFGAGGAARAITVELALAGAAHIIVVNRSRQTGHGLGRSPQRQHPGQRRVRGLGRPLRHPRRGGHGDQRHLHRPLSQRGRRAGCGLRHHPPQPSGLRRDPQPAPNAFPAPGRGPMGRKPWTDWACWSIKGPSPSRCGPVSPRRWM